MKFSVLCSLPLLVAALFFVGAQAQDLSLTETEVSPDAVSSPWAEQLRGQTWGLPREVEIVWDQDGELSVLVQGVPVEYLEISQERSELSFLALPAVPEEGEPDPEILEIDGTVSAFAGGAGFVLMYNVYGLEEADVSAGQAQILLLGSGDISEAGAIVISQSCSCSTIGDYCIASDCPDGNQCRLFKDSDCTLKDASVSVIQNDLLLQERLEQ